MEFISSLFLLLYENCIITGPCRGFAYICHLHIMLRDELTLKCVNFKMVFGFGYPRACRFRKTKQTNQIWFLVRLIFFKTWFLLYKKGQKLAKIDQKFNFSIFLKNLKNLNPSLVYSRAMIMLILLLALIKLDYNLTSTSWPSSSGLRGRRRTYLTILKRA
jgi:hypothetical protein